MSYATFHSRTDEIKYGLCRLCLHNGLDANDKLKENLNPNSTGKINRTLKSTELILTGLYSATLGRLNWL